MLMARPQLLANFLLCVLGEKLWYFQFCFYSTSESQMDRFGFSPWAQHTAFIIIFGAFGLHILRMEDAALRARRMAWSGTKLLDFATIIIGDGNSLVRGS